MKSLAQFGLHMLTATVALCLVGAFAAHLLLQFYIDHKRVKKETGEPGWKIFGSALAAREFYKEEAWWLWSVRRIGFIVFFVAIGADILIFAGAGIFGIALQ